MNAITPTIPQNANPANSVQSVESVVLDLGLKAQSRLLPYALGFFGIGLPLFLWTARLSLSPWLMAFYMLLFIVDWTVFMVLRAQAEKRAAAPSSERNLQSRLWRQSVGGGLWAFTLFVICLTASASGSHAEIFLMICAGAAAGVILFSTPVLLNLLVLGPIAMAGPVIAFHNLDRQSELGNFMTGGLALALAIGVVLNRHMREHYMLQHRQLEMAQEREAARVASDVLNEAKMALMETLSREVQTGLKGIEQNLLQSLALLARAPAPRQYVDAALGEVGHLQSILVTTLDNDTAAAGPDRAGGQAARYRADRRTDDGAVRRPGAQQGPDLHAQCARPAGRRRGDGRRVPCRTDPGAPAVERPALYPARPRRVETDAGRRLHPYRGGRFRPGPEQGRARTGLRAARPHRAHLGRPFRRGTGPEPVA